MSLIMICGIKYENLKHRTHNSKDLLKKMYKVIKWEPKILEYSLEGAFEQFLLGNICVFLYNKLLLMQKPTHLNGSVLFLIYLFIYVKIKGSKAYFPDVICKDYFYFMLFWTTSFIC